MAKIPEDIIRAIEQRAKIEEVVGDFLKLRKTGTRFTALCPFHDDRTDGNFIVYPKDNCYRCFTCDAKGGAVTFLMAHEKMSFPDAIRWLGKKYNIEVDDIPFDYVPPPAPPPPPPLPTLVLPRQMVAKRVGNLDADPLVCWMRTAINWDAAQRTRLEQALHDYCVGNVYVDKPYQRHEFTVFWQIDCDGNPRTAHYMKYKPDGHRLKDKNTYNTDWLHSLLERNKATRFYDPTAQEARQCLFGEHLLNRYPHATICLVESEKTAILMAAAYGNNIKQLWLASCGASNITRERLKPLLQQHRQIILYPDRDGIDAWRAKAENLHYDRVSLDTKPVTEWWREEDGPKADIADVVVRYLNEHKIYHTVEEVIEDIPALKNLKDKLNLELYDEG